MSGKAESTKHRLPGRDRRRNLGRKFALSAGVTILVLLGLEAGIRFRDLAGGRGFSSDHRNLLAGGMKPLRPFRTFGVDYYGERDGERCILSRHGEPYPLQRPEGGYRIVCFGGSTTEGRKESHYPALLQALLRRRLANPKVEVINVAYSGYATPHSLIVLELDVVSWQPDLVVLSHNINDLDVGYFEGSAFDYSNKYGRKFYAAPDYRRRFTTANVLLQHSQLYWVVRNALVDRPRWRVREIRRASLGDTPPAATSALFERNLRSFADLAKSKGIRVLLFTQPLQPDEEMGHIYFHPKAYDRFTTYPLHAEFVKHHRAYNRTIARVAEEEGVWFLDADTHLGGRREYFTDAVHYTPLGKRELAGRLADFLAPEGAGRRKDGP